LCIQLSGDNIIHSVETTTPNLHPTPPRKLSDASLERSYAFDAYGIGDGSEQIEGIRRSAGLRQTSIYTCGWGGDAPEARAGSEGAAFGGRDRD
jgi:hypothetical protein